MENGDEIDVVIEQVGGALVLIEQWLIPPIHTIILSVVLSEDSMEIISHLSGFIRNLSDGEGEQEKS